MGSQDKQGFGSGTPSYSLKGAVFEESTAKAIKLAHRRKWTALGTLLVLAAIGVGFLVFHNVTTNKEKDVVREYLLIDNEFIAESQKFQEKLQAAGDKAADMKPEFGPLADKFAEYAKKHSDRPIGWQSAFRAANLYLNDKKVDPALALLEPLVKKTLSNNLMQIKIRRTLAGLYADKKEFDKALSELDFLEKMPDNPALNEVKLFKGQVLYLAGKKDEAAKRLRELADNPLLGMDASAKTVSSEASMWLGYWGL